MRAIINTATAKKAYFAKDCICLLCCSPIFKRQRQYKNVCLRKKKILHYAVQNCSRVVVCKASVIYFPFKKFLVHDVISFDIFDTLILRPFDDPKSVFFLLGEKNKCPGFKRYRILAEKLARQEAFEKTVHTK